MRWVLKLREGGSDRIIRTWSLYRFSTLCRVVDSHEVAGWKKEYPVQKDSQEIFRLRLLTKNKWRVLIILDPAKPRIPEQEPYFPMLSEIDELKLHQLFVFFKARVVDKSGEAIIDKSKRYTRDFDWPNVQIDVNNRTKITSLCGKAFLIPRHVYPQWKCS